MLETNSETRRRIGWVIVWAWLGLMFACGGGGSTYVESSASPSAADPASEVAPAKDAETKEPAPVAARERRPEWDTGPVTMADYKSVMTGDSAHDVIVKLGPNYEELSQVELAGIKTVTWSWTNSFLGGGGNCTVQIQNGAVVTKAQFALPAGSAAESERKQAVNRLAIVETLDIQEAERIAAEQEAAAAEATRRREEAARQRLAEFRTWSDQTGDFSVVARLDSFRNHPTKGSVLTLEREDGTTVEVPTSRLSKDDAAWAREEIKRRAAAE